VLVFPLVGLGALTSHLISGKLAIVRGLVFGGVELTLPLSDSVDPVAFVPVSVAICESAYSILLTLDEVSSIVASVR